MTESGYHVGDLISYVNDSGSTRFCRVVTPVPGWSSQARYPWGHWANSRAEADTLYRNCAGSTGAQYCRRAITLIESYEGSTEMTSAVQAEEAVEFWFNGEPLRASMRATSITAGEQYRLIYPRGHHNMELLATARESHSGPLPGHGLVFEVIDWPVPRNDLDYNLDTYRAGYEWRSGSNADPGNYSYNFIIPAGVRGETSTEVQEEAYDGQKGAFLPHGGEMPEPGTIVRGMVHTTSSQVEGLFLRVETGGVTASVEAKRKRTRKADGTFTDWVPYSTRQSRVVTIDGAEVFKPGASKPAEAVLVRGSAITNAHTSAEVKIGDIFSGKVQYGSDHEVFRGEVLRVFSRHGEYVVNVTEQARFADGRQATGVYDWKPIDPREMQIYANWSDGDRGYDRAGYVWTKLEPGVKPVDPAFDPKRKTPFTGMGIGDVVVGLMKDRDGSRDTVSSWVKGEIIKWNVRYSRPIIKVTDKMESDKKVDAEVELVPEDTYPAMADPSAVSPEEYKKTLRLYLIGRHKRGDFCRGGLNTMLAAHGIPLYETRRRAQLVVQVDYDPNETDLYTVQQDLRRKMAGVSGLSFSERSGEDIELTLESDVTQG